MAQPRFSLGMCGLLLALAACNAPPGSEAGPRIPPSDEPLVLLPMDEILAQTSDSKANDTSAAALAARAAKLRARAGAN